MDHIIVNLDKVLSAYNGNIESVQHTSSLDNGSFINLGAFISGAREIRAVALPATATLATEEVLLVAAPELMAMPGTTLKDFYNPANVAMRAYHLSVGDIFTVSAAAITGSPDVTTNKYVLPADGVTTLAAGSSLGTTRFAGKIIEVTTIGYNKGTAYTIQVIKA